MDTNPGIVATLPGPNLNVVHTDEESRPVAPKAEVPGCSFRVNRPGRIEIYLYPTVRRARDVARPGDDVVPTDDGRAWLMRWIG